MENKKKKALEKAGYKFGDYADFLKLSREEKKLVERIVKKEKDLTRRLANANMGREQVR